MDSVENVTPWEVVSHLGDKLSCADKIMILHPQNIHNVTNWQNRQNSVVHVILGRSNFINGTKMKKSNYFYSWKDLWLPAENVGDIDEFCEESLDSLDDSVEWTETRGLTDEEVETLVTVGFVIFITKTL